MIDEAPGKVYERLAGLRLEIDGYRIERHELDVSSGFRRVTTEIVLVGGGLEGRGEDVTYAAEDHDDYPAELPLAGEWTLDGFSRQLGGLDLFPGRPPQQEFFRPYRRWGFESAALDLALRQRKLSLGEALRAPVRARPLRAQHAARHQAVARRRPSAGVQARPDAGVGRAPHAGDRGDRPRTRARLQVVLHGLARGQSARPRAVPARERDVPRHRARGPRAGGPGARGASRAGGPVQLRRAHPLLGRRGGRAAARRRRQRPS